MNELDLTVVSPNLKLSVRWHCSAAFFPTFTYQYFQFQFVAANWKFNTFCQNGIDFISCNLQSFLLKQDLPSATSKQNVHSFRKVNSRQCTLVIMHSERSNVSDPLEKYVKNVQALIVLLKMSKFFQRFMKKFFQITRFYQYTQKAFLPVTCIKTVPIPYILLPFCHWK